ncbi:hypothetical protein [Comamonas sp. BIGb0124]|uniref:hypothetical protein n=1 Tax=Comamonas sp. BIGb0124 TaxID=2485130 RepID=UPI000F49C8C0|nr:hypothetical protein [Comamonas sp. BIGb0124]
MSDSSIPELQRFLLTSSSMTLVEPYLLPGGGGVEAFMRDRVVAAWLDGYAAGQRRNGAPSVATDSSGKRAESFDRTQDPHKK